MSKEFEAPEFKDCSCGSRIRLHSFHNPLFPRVFVGACDCSYCGDSHFVMLGDENEVAACAAHFQAYLESRGKGVEAKFQKQGASCKSH
jgi:hypothetical protein